MAEIIPLTKLKKGHTYTLEIAGEAVKCKVIKETQKNVYKIKVLDGPRAGQFAYFTFAVRKKSIDPKF